MRDQIGASLLPHSSHTVSCAKHRDAEEDSQILAVHCYRSTWCRSLMHVCLTVVSGGVWFLLVWWFERLKLSACLSKAQPLCATHYYVVTQYSKELVTAETLQSPIAGQLRLFTHRHLRYYFCDGSFHPLLFDTAVPYRSLREKYQSGLSSASVPALRGLYGECRIDPPLKSIPQLFVDEVLHPFFVFQILACANWLWEGYDVYAYAILAITASSLAYTLYETRKNLVKVREMAIKTSTCRVCRDGNVSIVGSEELVPGDLIEIPGPGEEVPCDLVLLSGSCVLKESMLTGESIPVQKEPLPDLDLVYNLDTDKRFSLYQGTVVMQTRGVGEKPAVGVVMRTGFFTLKGKLVRAILYPKPTKFRFYEDSLKFIAALAVAALLGFAVTIKAQLDVEMNIVNLLQRSFDLITEAVPPALPAAMAVGTNIAIYRLIERKIYCTSPPRVNVCGNISQVCFDKTGTLTEDGMGLLGVLPVLNRSFQALSSDLRHVAQAAGLFVECLACCQGLSVIAGKVLGDAMDMTLFQATGWSYSGEEGTTGVKAGLRNEEGRAYSVLQIYHFSSRLKRMGVVVRDHVLSSHRLFVKGAPEVIIALCLPHTIPGNFNDQQATFTRAGYRVLACATLLLPDSFNPASLSSLSLEDLERNLVFLGIVVLQNKLKPQSAATIAHLHRANIHTLMATGDAVLTGITVARDCGIISGSDDVFLGELCEGRLMWEVFSPSISRSCFIGSSVIDQAKDAGEAPWLKMLVDQPDFAVALTGYAFHYLVKEAETGHRKAALLLRACLEKAKVYGRMSPELKALLVEKLQDLGLLVAMCGDGANDCGALKVADVGISLSEAEASIAAPFTSKVQDVSCVLTALIEGRCALSTSLQAFKFMAVYAMIQFLTVTVLYMWGSNLSPNQFLSIDLFLVLPLAMCMSLSGPCPELSTDQPPAALMSYDILLSVFGQGILALGSIIMAWVIIAQQGFYEPVDASGSTREDMIKAYTCYENTALYLFSYYTYLAVCLLFNIGRPFKLPAYTNPWFVVIFTLELFVSLYMILWPDAYITYFYNVIPTQLKYLPMYFRLVIVAECVGYTFIALAWEKLIVPCVSKAVKTRQTRKAMRTAREEYQHSLLGLENE